MKYVLPVLLPVVCACTSMQHSGEVHQAGALSIEVVWLKNRSRKTGPDHVHALIRLHNTGQETIELERDKWLSLSCASHEGYLVPGATMPGWTLAPGARREGVFIFRMEEKLPLERAWPVRIVVESSAGDKPVPECVIELKLKNQRYAIAKSDRDGRWHY